MALDGEMIAGAIGELRNAVSDLETTMAWAEYRELHALRWSGNLDSQLLQRRYGYLRERLNMQARTHQGYEPVADERQPGHDYRVRE